MLTNLTGIRNRKKRFCESKHYALFECGLTDECHRTFRQRAAERTEHWSVIFWLGGRNGRVGVSHERGRDRPAFQHHVRLHAEKSRIPNTEIGKLSNFNRADIRGNALSDRRVDRVFRHITPRPKIIVVAFLLSEPSELFLHFIGGLSIPGYHLATSAPPPACRRT